MHPTPVKYDVKEIMMRIVMGCTAVLSAVMAVGTMQAQAPGGTNTGGANAGAASAGGANNRMNNGPSSTSSMAGDAGSSANPVGDKMFVKKAISGNFNEIDASKMALQKSQNDQVKQFAQKMIDDHQKMLDDLHALAGQENIKFKDEPTGEGKKMAAKLNGLSGAEFDKAYVDGMVKDHKGDVKDFQTEISMGKDQPTKDAAQKSLPVIQDHLQMIEGIQKSMTS